MAPALVPPQTTTFLALSVVAAKSVATVGACACVGAYAHRQKVLDAKAQKALDKLVASIFLPCLILGKVTPNMNLDELLVTWPMAVMCLFMVSYGLLVGAAASKVLGAFYHEAFPHYRGLLMVAIAFPNSFSVPLTLMLAIGDHPALVQHGGVSGESLRSRISVMFLMSYAVWVLARWSIGYPILSGALTFGEWKAKVLNPPVVACVVATACGLLWSVATSLGLPLGAAASALRPCSVALDYAGRCSVPCILLALGARLDGAIADLRAPAKSASEATGVEPSAGTRSVSEPAPELVGLQTQEPEEKVERGAEAERQPDPRLPCCAYLLVVLLRQGMGTLISALLACGLLRGVCGVGDRVVLMVAMLQGAGPPMINLSVMAGLTGNAERETSKLLLASYGASVFTWTASMSLFLAFLA